jgi:hypothetical protein
VCQFLKLAIWESLLCPKCRKSSLNFSSGMSFHIIA